MDRKEPGQMTEDPRFARRFLSRRSAAEWANVSLATFDRWRQDPKMNFPKPVSQLLPTLRWRISDLERWFSDLAEQKRKP